MINPTYLDQFPLFFSNPTIRELANDGESNFISYTLEESGFFDSGYQEDISYANLFDIIYDLLVDIYRCEYVYKNNIANQLLIKRHSLRESSLLSEFRVGNSKADIVILNGNSSVYEIKTELDNYDRLQSQLSDYKKVFDLIFVTTHPSKLDKISEIIDDDIGIMILTDDLQIKTIREAKSNKHNVNPEFIFDTLRRNEYTRIIEKEFGYIPEVPNTLIYRECKDLFKKISPEIAHNHMVEALRQRSLDNYVLSLIPKLPQSLNMICLDNRLSKKEWSNFQVVLKKSLNK